jgi:hypothetical protein
MKNIGNVIIFHSGVGKEVDVPISVNTGNTRIIKYGKGALHLEFQNPGFSCLNA